MTDLDNRRRGERFAELVGLVLTSSGVDATARPKFKTLARAVETNRQRSDFLTTDVSVSCVNQASARRWSEGLDEAQRSAKVDGRAFYASIWHRPQRPVEEQFVLLDLGTFVHLLANGIEPQTGAKS